MTHALQLAMLTLVAFPSVQAEPSVHPDQCASGNCDAENVSLLQGGELGARDGAHMSTEAEDETSGTEPTTETTAEPTREATADCKDASAEDVEKAAHSLQLSAQSCSDVAYYCLHPVLGKHLATLCCITCGQVHRAVQAAQAAVPDAVQKVMNQPRCLGITAAAISYRFGQWPFYPIYTSILQAAEWTYQRSYNNTSSNGDFDHMGLWTKDSKCLVTFQGSDHLSDFGSARNTEKASFGGISDIHAGFLQEFTSLFAKVDFNDPIWNCESITVAGHSLGGSLAQIFTAVLNSDSNAGTYPKVDSVYIYGAPSPFTVPPPTCTKGHAFANAYSVDGVPHVDMVKILGDAFKPLNLPLAVYTYKEGNPSATVPGTMMQKIACSEKADMNLSTFESAKTTPGEDQAHLHSAGTYAALLGCWDPALVELWRM